eukprot:CAMPEP_0172319060 /NCGR_PEP_ID=MMETSP1058-20130122/36657_1 /TAXON_ID=83371 /ORGANISM="Detonula confervacea, Strain CCMP 353" /LENGTH=289 /DNA_ID=CAMNT_0013034009 /DNA_START=24 /DNA_END=890 /DNA_ORIENTATION=-
MQWQQRLAKNIATVRARRHRTILRSVGGEVVRATILPTSAVVPPIFFSHQSIGGLWMSNVLNCGIITNWGGQQRRGNIITARHSLQSRGFAHSGVQRTTRDPDMRNCRTIEEVTQMAYDHVDNMSPRGMSAFWTLVSKILQKRSRGSAKGQNNHGQMQQQMAQQLDTILVRTLENIEIYSPRDLATTTVGLAKIVKLVGSSGPRLLKDSSPQILRDLKKRSLKGSPHQILRDLLIGNNSENKQSVFHQIARASIPILHEFDARSLSNFIYAFAIADYAPKFEDGSTFYD